MQNKDLTHLTLSPLAIPFAHKIPSVCAVATAVWTNTPLKIYIPEKSIFKKAEETWSSIDYGIRAGC